MSDSIGLFTGSFDPITLGHLVLVKRASGLFDNLYVGLLDVEARQRILEELFAEEDRISVLVSSNELVVDVARRVQATHLIRVLSNGHDFEYDSIFFFYNRELAPERETIYLLAKPEFKFVSSSQIRELIHFQQDISKYVPKAVIKELAAGENT